MKKNSFKSKFNNKNLINIAIIVILILTSMMVSYTYRIQTEDLPSLDVQAQNSVVSFYKEQLKPDVDKEYSFVSEEEREQILNERVIKYLGDHEKRVTQEMKTLTNNYKSSLKDENGDTYLLAIDPYMQYQYTKNYLKTGTWGNKIVDGKPVNTLRGGRINHNDGNRFHPWLMSKFHKLMLLFNPKQSLLKSVFLFPVFWTTLAIIPAFFIGFRLSKSKIAGFLAALIIGVHRIILSRTIGGFSDTDTHNVFFPLYIFWMVVESLRAKTLRAKLIWSSLGALFTGVYSVAWSGWWHIYDFMFIGMLGYIIVIIAKELYNSKKFSFSKIKNDVYNVAVYFIGTIIVNGIIGIFMSGRFSGFLKLKTAITGPLSFIFYKSVGISTIWPNVMTTVAELNTTNITDIISTLGSKFFYLLGLIGIVLVLFNNKNLLKKDNYVILSAVGIYLLIFLFASGAGTILYLILLVLPIIMLSVYTVFYESNIDMKYSVLIAIMFIGTMYASTRGVRFTSLLIPVVTMGVAISFGVIYKKFSSYASTELEINIIIPKAVLLLIFLIVLIPGPMTNGWSTATNSMPSYNDAWDSTLKTINQSSEDAIITSWWDFGHWFVAGSQRRVTFDGGDQGRRIHWVGKTLLEDNESEAIDILRMLNCDQNGAVKYLEERFSAYESVNIINKIIHLKKSEAKDVLESKYQLSSDETSILLEKTHCSDLIDQYFIASSDMIGKSGVWAHFGIWDFDRAYMYNSVKGTEKSEGTLLLENEFNLSKKDAKKVYREIQKEDGDKWIASWPSYYGQRFNCVDENNTVKCKSGLTYDKEKEEIYIFDGNTITYPKNILYENKKGEIVYTEFTKKTTDYGAILYKSNGRYQLVLAMPELTGSMFTKMYYFKGKGLEYFTPVSSNKGPDGVNILLYKVDLSKGEK